MLCCRRLQEKGEVGRAIGSGKRWPNARRGVVIRERGCEEGIRLTAAGSGGVEGVGPGGNWGVEGCLD